MRFLFCLVLLVLTSCGTQQNRPLTHNEMTLIEAVHKYEKATHDQDYATQSQYILPPLVKARGGHEEFARFLKTIYVSTLKTGLDFTKLDIYDYSQVQESDKLFYSKLFFRIPMSGPKFNGEFYSNLYAVKYKNQGNWYLFDLNEKTKAALTEMDPSFLEKVDPPMYVSREIRDGRTIYRKLPWNIEITKQEFEHHFGDRKRL